MSSRLFSISSSDGRRYVTVFAAIAAVTCIAIAGISAWGYVTGTLAATFSDLYEYQLAKLATVREIDTVFVGDSSLGNAIDARVWQQLSGRAALNLSLTGAYGYAGSLNMLTRVVARGRPRKVIIFHTIDMLTRPVEHEGYLRSAASASAVLDVPAGVVAKVYLNLDTAVGVLERLALPSQAASGIDRERDAGRQGPAEADAEKRYRERRLHVADVKAEKLYYLRLLAALCARERLDCVYVHGPIVQSICRQSNPYLDKVNQLIDSTGLRRARATPVCMPYEDVGDTEDHVKPDRRRDYTERYYALLAESP